MLLLIGTVSKQAIQVGTAERGVFSFDCVADANSTCCKVVSREYGDPMIGTIVLSNTTFARNKDDQFWLSRPFGKRTCVSQYITWIEPVFETSETRPIQAKGLSC